MRHNAALTIAIFGTTYALTGGLIFTRDWLGWQWWGFGYNLMPWVLIALCSLGAAGFRRGRCH